jgi:hypothetical protein
MVKVKGATVYASEAEVGLRSVEEGAPGLRDRPSWCRRAARDRRPVFTGEPLATIRASASAPEGAQGTDPLARHRAGHGGAHVGVGEGGQAGPPTPALRPGAPRRATGLTAGRGPRGSNDRGSATRRPRASVTRWARLTPWVQVTRWFQVTRWARMAGRPNRGATTD